MVNIRIIGFLLLGTLACFLLLRTLGAPLVKPASRAGIVSLELAHRSSDVGIIMREWDSDGLLPTARTNILIDFLFIPFYSLLFYTLCGMISVRLKGAATSMGVVLAFGSLVAGVLDCGENILMLFSLQGHYNDISAMLTAALAYTKFCLLLLASLYILTLGSVHLARKFG